MATDNLCTRLAEDLTAYAQGELAPERAAEVEAHVAACGACRAEVAMVRGIFALAGVVEDVVPSPRLARRVEELRRKAERPRRRESPWFRVRTAAAYIFERIRTSPRFRLAAISVAVHAAILFALSFFVLPKMADPGPHEFVTRFEPPLGGSEEPVRPDPAGETATAPVAVDGAPHPRVPEELLPPLPLPPTGIPGGGLPPEVRTLSPAIAALFGTTIDDELKRTRLAALVPDGPAAGEAIARGLGWLASQQEENGSFAPITRNPSYRTGVTAFVTLAFLSDGHSHTRGRREWRVVVGRAVDRLLLDQQQSGRLAGLIGAADGHYMYNHALATLALVEVWSLDFRRLPRERSARLRAAIGQAVGFLVSAQTPRGGWRYEYPLAGGDENDTSVSIFAGMALGAAKSAGFAVPPESVARLSKWLAGVTGEDGLVGYQAAGDRADAPRTLTAGALFIEEVLGFAAGLRDRQAAAVRAELADGHGSTSRNGLLRLYSALAFRLRGEKVLRYFAPETLFRQRPDGSFPSADDLHGVHAGDVFQTALEILTFTTAYHFAGS